MAAFTEYKNRVGEYFGKCIQFAESNGFNKQAEMMRESKKRLDKKDIVVVVVGEARRGKSSLLAAYLEDEGLFPVDVDVTTCLATVVSYSETEKVTVTFANDSEKVITRSDIKEYAQEKYNKDNAKQVKWIAVETPNQKLKSGITVVDTPGVGSLNPQHTEATYQFLPNADVVLFASDATAELTSPELVFLKGVKKYCDKILFVLTKKDMEAAFQTIIDGNTARITEFASIAADQIRYIPVSSTMRLAGLQNGSDKMNRASNFTSLETAVWNMIENNRSEIIIAPVLGELASLISEIEKDIHIRETGLIGSASEMEDMKATLQKMQKDRQKLLSESATWQMDIQREIEIIAGDQTGLMLNFKDEALIVMERGLKEAQLIKNPELLLNEIVLMASTASREISDDVYRRLSELKHSFEEETRLNLYDNIVKNNLNVDDDPAIVFDKLSVVDTTLNRGRDIMMNTMGGSVVGGIIGGAIGAIIGVFGGPAGIIAGVTTGAAWGAGGGTFLGGTKGVYDAVKNPSGREAKSTIGSAINKYISQTVSEWQINHTRNMKDISHKFIKSLRDSIKTNQETIENDMAELQKSAALSVSKREEEAKKLTVVKAGFIKMAEGFSELCKTKVKPITAKQAASAEKEETDESVNYSNLED